VTGAGGWLMPKLLLNYYSSLPDPRQYRSFLYAALAVGLGLAGVLGLLSTLVYVAIARTTLTNQDDPTHAIAVAIVGATLSAATLASSSKWVNLRAVQGPHGGGAIACGPCGAGFQPAQLGSRRTRLHYNPGLVLRAGAERGHMRSTCRTAGHRTRHPSYDLSECADGHERCRNNPN
jgi:hypothetical protein